MTRVPDGRDAALVAAAMLFIYAGLGFLPAAIPMPLRSGLLQVFLLAVPLVYARMAGLGPIRAAGFRRMTRHQALLVLVASLGSLWILKALSDLELHLLPKIGVETAYEVEHLNRGVKKATEENGLLAVAVFVVVPAFCEEIFFRGLVFRGIARSFSPAWAIAGTTVLFSFAHGTVVQRVMMIFAGLYFGTVVWLSGSLWAGIMAHAVNNLAVIAVTHFFGDQLDRLAAPAWLLALSLVVFVSALALLRLERPDERG